MTFFDCLLWKANESNGQLYICDISSNAKKQAWSVGFKDVQVMTEKDFFKRQRFTKVMVICILLLDHEIRSLSLAGLFEYVYVHYLKIEVAKYIFSLLRIFKTTCKTQQSRDFNNGIQMTMTLDAQFLSHFSLVSA